MHIRCGRTIAIHRGPTLASINWGDPGLLDARAVDAGERAEPMQGNIMAAEQLGEQLARAWVLLDQAERAALEAEKAETFPSVLSLTASQLLAARATLAAHVDQDFDFEMLAGQSTDRDCLDLTREAARLIREVPVGLEPQVWSPVVIAVSDALRDVESRYPSE